MKVSRFLFLQGQISRFFSELGIGLDQRGHLVRRINFNGGDRRFWQLPGSADFTGDVEHWPEFLSGRLEDWGISDLILFGDCRPLHALAIELAKARDIRVHVFEEGYLRPHFITLEPGGVNGHSSLPRDAAAYLEAAASLPPCQPAQAIPASFSLRAREDVLYNLSTALGAWRFPQYRSHRPWHPFREYAVGVSRFPAKLLQQKQTLARAESVWRGSQPYFLFPLQLDADTQIRFHAPEGGMVAAIRRVMQSFAAQAPREALLVLTEHPLDYGPVDLQVKIASLAEELALSERVVFLRGGSPTPLVQSVRGLVTVNSTIGITAMEWQIPVIALGTAIYDLPGLSCQQGIDAFWNSPEPPQPKLFDAFRRVVAARTQINGGFYSSEGIALAVAGAIERLEHAAAEIKTPSAARPQAGKPFHPRPARKASPV